MSESLSVELVYGIKVFGANDESWPYPYDEDTYEPVWPEWVKLEDDGEPEDFGSQVENRLIKVLAGFSEPEPQVNWDSPNYRNDPNMPARDAWRQRKNATAKAAGIGTDEGELGLYYAGTTNYQDTYLGYLLFQGSGSANECDLDAVQAMYHSRRSYKGWQETIAQALAALNFQIDKPEPKLWLLADYS